MSFGGVHGAGVQGFEPQLPDPESDDSRSTTVYSRRFVRKPASNAAGFVCICLPLSIGIAVKLRSNATTSGITRGAVRFPLAAAAANCRGATGFPCAAV
jgi:hypothetical protein